MLQIEEQEQENNNLQLVKDQHLAIKRLESDIVDVNQIFQDLGRMVHEQQDLVDTIENNVENSQIQLESGNQELQRAAEYQARN
jgi:t-SNARE complex subunit (syntaxin)